MGDISRVIPLNVHADGVETFHDVEFHVFSWASALTYKGIGDVLDKIFLVLVLDEIRMIPHVTYSMVVQFLKWSLAAMNTGLWPDADHLGRPFAPGSSRAARAGTALANGWRAVFSSWSGDAKV